MNFGPLSLALTAGVVAAFNPCGFAMLPAYVSYYVGATGAQKAPLRERLLRAGLTGLTVSAGFMALFGAVGFVLTEITTRVNEFVPWISIVIGIALALLGMAMLRGFEPTFSLPKVGQAAKGRSFKAMFVYGVSYGTVSLSCTLPVFLATVVGTLKRTSLLAGIATYLVYALGMSVVLIVLSFGVAIAQQPVVRFFRRALRYVNRVSGLLLVLAGLYVAWYGYYEVRLQRGGNPPTGPVALVTNLSERIQSFAVEHVGTSGVLLALGAVAAVMCIAALIRSTHSAARADPGDRNDSNTDSAPAQNSLSINDVRNSQ